MGSSGINADYSFFFFFFLFFVLKIFKIMSTNLFFFILLLSSFSCALILNPGQEVIESFEENEENGGLGVFQTRRNTHYKRNSHGWVNSHRSTARTEVKKKERGRRKEKKK